VCEPPESDVLVENAYIPRYPLIALTISYDVGRYSTKDDRLFSQQSLLTKNEKGEGEQVGNWLIGTPDGRRIK
jgi:hypothetical protein